MQTAVQFSFTTLFGWYAAHLLLVTGHLAAPVLVHVFCNAMGLPDFSDIPQHPHAGLLSAAVAAGIGGFAVGFTWLNEPVLYCNDSVAGISRYQDALKGVLR